MGVLQQADQCMVIPTRCSILVGDLERDMVMGRFPWDMRHHRGTRPSLCSHHQGSIRHTLGVATCHLLRLLPGSVAR